jgi:hypothetical protein
VGGIKYTVHEGKTGFLVPPHQPAALAQKIQQLIYDEQLLSVMQRNCLKHVRKYFTWKGVASKCDQLYEKVVAVHQQELKRKTSVKPAVYELKNEGLFANSPFNKLQLSI